MNNKIKEFNEYIRDNFKNCWDVPGLAICIFDDNKILFKKAFGYANVPVTYLACHTSGITDWFNNCPKKRLVLKKYEDMEGIESRKKVTKIILSQPPHYNPGSKYEYSNIAYGILGGIVEKYTGESYNNIIYI